LTPDYTYRGRSSSSRNFDFKQLESILEPDKITHEYMEEPLEQKPPYKILLVMPNDSIKHTTHGG
jgi:hypothetical protein